MRIVIPLLAALYIIFNVLLLLPCGCSNGVTLDSVIALFRFLYLPAPVLAIGYEIVSASIGILIGFLIVSRLRRALPPSESVIQSLLLFLTALIFLANFFAGSIFLLMYHLPYD